VLEPKKHGRAPSPVNSNTSVPSHVMSSKRLGTGPHGIPRHHTCSYARRGRSWGPLRSHPVFGRAAPAAAGPAPRTQAMNSSVSLAFAIQVQFLFCMTDSCHLSQHSTNQARGMRTTALLCDGKDTFIRAVAQQAATRPAATRPVAAELVDTLSISRLGWRRSASRLASSRSGSCGSECISSASGHWSGSDLPRKSRAADVGSAGAA